MMRYFLGLVFAIFLLFKAFGQDESIWTEEFDNNEFRWPIGSNSHVSAIVTNGQYIIDHKREDQVWTFTQNVPFNPVKNWTISTKIHHVSGSKKHTYGVVFGGLGMYDPKTNGKEQKAYAFDMVDNGRFALSRLENGVLETLYAGKAKKVINQMGAENVLEIKHEGGVMIFSINQQEVHRHTLVEFYGARIGFLINQEAKLKIDYLEVTSEEKAFDLLSFYKADAMDRGIHLFDGSLEFDDGTLLDSTTNPSDREKVIGSDDHGGGVYLARNDCSLIRKIGTPQKWTEEERVLPYDIKLCNVIDNGRIVLVKGFYNGGTYLKPGFSIISKQGIGWSSPVGIDVPNLEYYNKGRNYHGYLVEGGEVLVLSMSATKRSQNNNLYVSIKGDNNQWSVPKSLGPVINNGKSRQSSAILSADGRKLYFASNGHPGYGDMDLFYAVREGDSWVKWSKPENLGPKLNDKSRNEFFHLSNSGKLYLVHESENNNFDVKMFVLPEALKP